MEFLNKTRVWVAASLIFSLCLSCFAAAALLDIFVIEHESDEEISIESVDFGNQSGTLDLEGSKETTKKPSTNKNNKETSTQKATEATGSNSIIDSNISPNGDVLTEEEIAALAKSISVTKQVGTYENDNVALTVTEKVFKSGNDKTTYFVVDIRVSSAEYVKTALASGNKLTSNQTKTVATMAKAQNAILAINGDGCGQSARSRGYVVRNGITYRSTASTSGDTEALVMLGDGTMKIIDQRSTSLNSIDNEWHVFSFGPALINNGKISVTKNQEINGQSMDDNPRTSIGMVEPLHYVIIVGDGRTNNSKGLTLYQLAQALAYEGCTVGYNLDGGGSTTLWFNGEVINYPTTNGRYSERAVSDIVYIEK